MWKKEDTSPAEERLFGQQTHTDLSKAERSGLDVYQLKITGIWWFYL